MTRTRTPVSVRRKLFVFLMPPVLLIAALSAVLAYTFAVRFATLAYDRALYETARDIGNEAQISSGRLTVDLPDESLRMIRSDQWDTIYYVVRDSAGHTVAGTPELAANAGDGAPAAPTYFDATLLGHPVRVATLTRSMPEPYGVITVEAAETLNKRKMMISEILIAMAIPELILLALAGCAIWYGVTASLRPLTRFRNEIETRSHLDLNLLKPEHFPVEVLPLVHGMNALFIRLSAAMDEQKRFVSDAAHQLRTPLAGLRVQINLALEAASSSELRDALGKIDMATARATHLAQQLLSLARADPHSVGSRTLETVDLAAVARETASDWVPHALERNADLGFEDAGACRVVGDPTMLREMLSNLIENALLYGGKVVTVAVSREGDAVMLSVSDNGRGIPPDEREKIFQRFYSVPGGGSTGSGLGLSIVRQIAESHGGRVEAGTGGAEQGAVITITLPCAP